MTETMLRERADNGVSETTNGLAELHPNAVGFTLFRLLPRDRCRTYTSVEFDRGWADADWFLRQLHAFGYVQNSTPAREGWHVLDVLDAESNVIQDYAVPPAPSGAMAYIIRKLGLRVEKPHVRGEPQTDTPATPQESA